MVSNRFDGGPGLLEERLVSFSEAVNRALKSALQRYPADQVPVPGLRVQGVFEELGDTEEAVLEQAVEIVQSVGRRREVGAATITDRRAAIL